MRYPTLILSLICMVFAAGAANAERARRLRRRQRHLQERRRSLPNPPIDAKAMAGALRNVGFEVVEGTNLTRDKMTEKLLDFGKKAQGADVAVFFYAGHGIAISGTNYLLPVDADIKSEMDVKLGAAINIDLTLDQTMSDAKVKLVFLDACRDNPFAAKIKSNSATRSVSVQTGLAEMKSGEGTLIAFATGPGQTALDGQEGANSPFTRALIANITDARRRDPAGDDQGPRPGQRGDQQGPTALGPHQPDRLGLSEPARPRRPPPRRRAAARSRSHPHRAATSNSSSGARSRIPTSRKSSTPICRSYPNGQFKSLALARIASLENGPTHRHPQPDHRHRSRDLQREANQTTEDQIGLDKGQRRDVQRRLNGLGFDTKVTGKFDERPAP